VIEIEQPSDQRSSPIRPANKFKVPLIVLASALALYMVLNLLINFFLDDWSKQKLEQVISTGIKRDVHLGRVSWNMGLDGLDLHMASIDVKDLDGSPLLRAGKTDVSVALWPLLQQQIEVRHVDSTKPVLWAKKLSWGAWNTTDLAESPALKYINHLGVHDGTLHLAGADQTKHDSETLVEHLNGAIEKPFGNFSWHYNLSFAVPHAQDLTSFNLKGTGSGKIQEWKKDDLHFTLHAENFNPYDFITTKQPLSYLQGPVVLDVVGSGVPEKGLNAKVHVKTPQLEFSADKLTFTGADAGETSPNAASTPGAAAPPGSAPTQGATATSGSPTAPDTIASVPGGKPVLSGLVTMDGATLKLPNVALLPTSVKGQISFTGDRYSFNQVSGKIGDGGAFTLNGTAEPDKSINIVCDSTTIDLDKVRQSLHALKISTPAVLDHPFFGIVKEGKVEIAGAWNKPAVIVTASPQDVYYRAPGQRDQLFQGSQGRLRITADDVVLNSVAGRLGNGTYQIDGKIGLKPHLPIDLTFKGEHVEVATVKQALAALGVDTKAIDPAVGGSVKGAVGSVRGTYGSVTVSMAVVPDQVIYQPPGTQRVITLIGGRVDVINTTTLHFYQTKGRLADAAFELDGISGTLPSSRQNLKFHGQNLDLSHVKVALQELKVQSPLLAEQLLYGKVKTVSLGLKGTALNPSIAMLCFPDDVLYEPIGSTRPMHLRGGRVTYKGDTLSAQNIHVTTVHSEFTTNNIVIDSLSTTSQLRKFSVDAAKFDAIDLHSYLQAPRTPPALREQYLALLDQLQIVPHQGKLHGHVDWQGHGDTFDLACNATLDHISATAFGVAVEQVSGRVQTTGDQFNINQLSGKVGHSPFTARGSISHFNDQQKQSWSLALSTDVHLNNLLKTLSEHYKPQGQIHSPQPIALNISLTGSSNELTAEFNAKVAPQAPFYIRGPYGGEFNKPIGQPLTLAGSMVITPAQITIKQAQGKLSDTEVDLTGTMERSQKPKQIPSLDFRLSIPNLIPIRDALSFLSFRGQPLGTPDVTGTFRGHLHVKGQADRPASYGLLIFNDVSMPAFHMTHLSGQAVRADHRGGNADTPTHLDIKQVSLDKCKLTNLVGDVVPCNTPGCDSVEMKNFTASYATGKVTLNGSISPSTPAHFSVQAQAIDPNALITDLFGSSGEMSGTMDGAAQLDADLHASDLLTSISGQGTVKVTNGKVARLSALERGISAENVIHSNLFTFNLNNLISTVAPFQSGKFTEISTSFAMSKGQLSINDVFYRSKELRMRAKGIVNLAKNSLQVNVAGAVPRVSTRGILGPIARFLSIHGLTDFIEDLPEKLSNHYVPNDTPRAFAFKISAPADKPKTIADSIMKSFHWLKPRPAATPHPAVLEGQTDSGTPVVATAAAQLHTTSTSDGITAAVAGHKSRLLPFARPLKDIINATTKATGKTPTANQPNGAQTTPAPATEEAKPQAKPWPANPSAASTVTPVTATPDGKQEAKTSPANPPGEVPTIPVLPPEDAKQQINTGPQNP